MCIVVEHRPNTMVMVSGAKGTKGAVYVIVCRLDGCLLVCVSSDNPGLCPVY